MKYIKKRPLYLQYEQQAVEKFLHSYLCRKALKGMISDNKHKKYLSTKVFDL
jgi:hypothetical protein